MPCGLLECILPPPGISGDERVAVEPIVMNYLICQQKSGAYGGVSQYARAVLSDNETAKRSERFVWRREGMGNTSLRALDRNWRCRSAGYDLDFV